MLFCDTLFAHKGEMLLNLKGLPMLFEAVI